MTNILNDDEIYFMMSSLNLKKKENLELTNIIKCNCENESSPYEIGCSIVCVKCGYVLNNNIILLSNEIAFYNSEDTPGSTSMQRVGAPIDFLMPKRSMTTFIHGDSTIAKLNLYLSVDYKENVLYILKKKLQEITINYNIPIIIINTSLHIFKKILDSNKIFRAKNKKGLEAVCVFYSCKIHKIYLLPSFLLKIFDIDKKVFTNCCKIYYNNFDDGENISLKEEITSIDIVTRLSNQLNLEFKYQKLFKKIILTTKYLGLFSNLAPQSIASSVVIFVYKELDFDLSIKLVSELSDTSEAVIIKLSKLLTTHKIKIFNFIKYGIKL